MDLMDFLYFVIVPCGVSLLQTIPRFRGNPRASAGLCLLSAILVAFALISRNNSTSPHLATQVALFAVSPSTALFLTSIVLITMRRPLFILLFGPVAYWVSFVIGVNVWQTLGYPI